MGKQARRTARKELDAASVPRNAQGARVYTSEMQELPDPVKFELDGYEYTCRELSPIEISEIARLNGLDAQDPRSVAFLAEFFDMLLGSAEYAVFRRRVVQFSTGQDVIMRLVEGVFEDFTNRPTVRRSGSSDTPLTTSDTSTEDYSDQAMRQLEGRPDLQLAVKRAQNED